MTARGRRFWTDGAGSFFIAVAIALVIRWAFLESYVIPSGSMLPTLLVHDHIFVNKINYGLRVPFTEKWLFKANEPKKGEVVVFKFKQGSKQDDYEYYIKRIVGTPGDRVFYENGNLYINDQLIERRVPQVKKEDFAWLRNADFPGEEKAGGVANYVHWEEVLDDKVYSTLSRKSDSASPSFGPVEVPPNHYFMMGDNRDNSQDSRVWSEEQRFVPRENLVGRAMFVWLSCERTFSRLTFICNPMTLRFQRFFHSID